MTSCASAPAAGQLARVRRGKHRAAGRQHAHRRVHERRVVVHGFPRFHSAATIAGGERGRIEDDEIESLVSMSGGIGQILERIHAEEPRDRRFEAVERQVAFSPFQVAGRDVHVRHARAHRRQRHGEGARVGEEIEHPCGSPLRQRAPVVTEVEEEAGRVPIVEAHLEARGVLLHHEGFRLASANARGGRARLIGGPATEPAAVAGERLDVDRLEPRRSEPLEGQPRGGGDRRLRQVGVGVDVQHRRWSIAIEVQARHRVSATIEQAIGRHAAGVDERSATAPGLVRGTR